MIVQAYNGYKLIGMCISLEGRISPSALWVGEGASGDIVLTVSPVQTDLADLQGAVGTGSHHGSDGNARF